MVLAALVAVVAAALGYLRTWPPLATVMSASMAPTIDTGDVVVLKRLDAPARIGDVVAITVPDEARSRYGYPPVVIHRVVGLAPDGTVTTQGDARKEPDPFAVPQAALTKKVVATAPAGGQVLAFLGSPLGLLWLASGALLLVGMPLAERLKRRGREERDELLVELEQQRDALAAAQARACELAAALAALPAQIERAVAAGGAARPAAVAVREAEPPAVVAAGGAARPVSVATREAAPLAAPAALAPEPAFACVPASQWRRPAPGAWDAPPADLQRERAGAGVLCAAPPPPARRFVRRPMLAPLAA
jgi:signal peptidase I